MNKINKRNLSSNENIKSWSEVSQKIAKNEETIQDYSRRYHT